MGILRHLKTRLRRGRLNAEMGLASLDSIAQDVRYGLRQLRRTPLFTMATVATLGLTLGATTALFAIANAVVLRPLPYPASDRIVSISFAPKGTDSGRMDEPTALLALEGKLSSFESLAIYSATNANLTGGAQPERVSGVSVSDQFFDVMRTQPALGRTFLSDERRAGGPRAIVLSASLWTRAFGRSPDVLQREVKLDDQNYKVVGVMPPDFRFPGRTDFWLPLPVEGRQSGTGVYYVDFIGRLSDRGTVTTAAEDLLALRKSRQSGLPVAVRESGLRVMTQHERLYGDFRIPIMLLLGAVACVLFIGCANIANLLLARGALRRHELAIRAALGAGRGRLARQMLIESVLLALLGGIPAFVLLMYALQAFAVLGPTELRTIPGIAIDAQTLAFMLAATVTVGLLFGMAPALAAGRTDTQEPLKGAGRRGGHSVSSNPRRILVMLEIAAAVVVMVGAALLAKSLIRFQAVDRGFHADNILLAAITLPQPRYADVAARRVFYDGVLERLRSLPSVESVAVPAGLGSLSMTMAWPPGTKLGPPSSESEAIGVSSVGTSYFKTFDIPILSGRECDGVPESSAVINERMARRAFPGQSPLGQRVNLSLSGTFTIVGVAADVRRLGTNAPPLATVFRCVGPREAPNAANIALRARGAVDAATLAPALRAAVAAVDPTQPVAAVTTLRQLTDDSVASRRFETLLFGGFALLAFTLAALGLYAVTAYLVAQQTHEFGVRIALGAGPSAVLRLVLRQALTPVISGITLGLVAAALLTGLLRKMLYAVDVLDMSVFAGVALVLAAVSLAAAVVPARRAVRLDPIVALRCE